MSALGAKVTVKDVNLGVGENVSNRPIAVVNSRRLTVNMHGNA